MFQLLIVDDELNLVDGLADYLLQIIPDISILKAHSGPKALELLSSYHVDLIISDIKMPEMSGLELLACIEDRYPHIRIIFLSAFAEFDWAQQALQYKCCADYILKTQGDDVILASVLKQLDSLQQERNHFLDEEEISECETTGGETDQNQIIDKILRNDRIDENINFTGIVGMFLRSGGSHTSDQFMRVFRSVVCECFWGMTVAVDCLNCDHYVCLIPMNTDSYNCSSLSLFARFERVVEQMASLNEKINCVFSGKLLPVSEMQQMLEYLQQTRLLIAGYESGVIVDAFEQENEVCVDEEYTIRMIKKYILDNLSDENLSQSTIARRTHYAPSYLSRMFKQKTGLNMMTYISQMRLARACELLMQGNYNVKDIGKMVGITSPSYFSAFFRRHTGMTPIQYIRHNMEK